MPTATFVKFNQFVEDLCNGKHDLMGTGGSGADVLKCLLSNTAPNVSTGAVKADITEISSGNGYTAGGYSVTNVGTRSGGTFSLTGTDIVITASGGPIATFRYVVMYNDTQATPVKPLVAYWDYGSSIAPADTETFTIDFGATILTLS